MPQDPVYKSIIVAPMWFNKIKANISKKYKSMPAFREDMMLLFSNAMLYNDDGTSWYLAAKMMRDHFEVMYDAKMKELGLASDGQAMASPADSSSTPAARSAGSGPKITLKLGKQAVPVNKVAEGGIKKRTGGAAGKAGKGKGRKAASTTSEEESDVDMSDGDSDD